MGLLFSASVLFLLSLILPAFASEEGGDEGAPPRARTPRPRSVAVTEREQELQEINSHKRRLKRLQDEQNANEALRQDLSKNASKRRELLELEEDMKASALELAAIKLELELAEEKDTAAKAELIKKIRKLKKETALYNEELAKSKKFAGEAASSFAGMLGIKNDLVGGIASFITMNKGLKGSFSALTDEMSKTITNGSIFSSILAKIVQATGAVAMAQDQAISSFRRSTGAFSDEYVAGMEQTFMANRNLGVTMEETGEAATALYQNMASFTTLQKSVRDELTNTVTLLNEIGVSANTSSRAFDVLNKVYNISADRVDNITRELTDFAMNLGLSVTRVLDDLAATAPSLSQWGDHAIDVFMDLERVSKGTGIAIQNLIGIAKQFDTFEGAAEAAGRLNAMLGGPYMNSIELLNAEEGERLTMLRESISLSGKNWDSLGRFEKQAIAAAAGISSMEEANRLFGMSNAEYEESIRLADQNSMEQERLRELAREAQTVFDNMKAAVQSLAVAIGPVINAISGFFARLADGLSWMTENLGGFGTVVSFVIGAVGLLAAPVMVVVSAFKAMNLQKQQANALAGIQSTLLAQESTNRMASLGPRYTEQRLMVTKNMLMNQMQLNSRSAQFAQDLLANSETKLGIAIDSGNQKRIQKAMAEHNNTVAMTRSKLSALGMTNAEITATQVKASGTAATNLSTLGINSDTIAKTGNAAATGVLATATGFLTVAMQGLNKALGPIMLLFSLGSAIATIIGMFKKKSSPRFTEYLGIAADETSRWTQANRDVIPSLDAVGTAMSRVRPQVAQAAKVDPNQVMTGTTIGITPVLRAMAQAIPTLAATVEVEGNNAFETNQVLKASVAKLDVVRDDNRQVVNAIEKMTQSNKNNAARLESIANREVRMTLNDREFGRATRDVLDRELRTSLSSV